MTSDPTFDAVALAELRDKGITCRSCCWWRRKGDQDATCAIERGQPPRVCKWYDYEPGSDEGGENGR